MTDKKAAGTNNMRNEREPAPRKPENISTTIRRLLSYLSKYKGRLILAFICAFISSMSGLAGSYMLRPLINGIIVNGISVHEKITSLAVNIILMAVIYLIGVVSSYLQQRIMMKISQYSVHAVRMDLFSRMQRLPIKFFEMNSVGDIMSRYTNDVDAVGEMLSSTVIQLFQGAIMIVGTFCLMMYTNPFLTAVTLVTAPLMILVGGAIAGKSRKHFQAQQELLGQLNGYAEEMVAGQNTVKAFCQEDKVISDFKSRSSRLRESQLKAQFFGGIIGPVMSAMGQFSYTVTAMVGALLCLASGIMRLDIGGLTVFVNYSRQFSRPINEISQQATTILSALAGAERVFKIMDSADEYTGQEGNAVLTSSYGEVKIDNVSFGYEPGQVVLKSISVYAQRGRRVAIVGSTGAGKTTIMNLLTRFYDVDSGKIYIDNTPIETYTKDSLRENIDVVFQDTYLFTGTVMENIRYGRLDATDEEVISAAKAANAHSFIMHLPNGYETVINANGSNLSQGQQQLLNIARAALSNAPILILDEATSSIDTKTERDINQGMSAIMQNRTVFVIAHRLSTVKDADIIMVMENGAIIESGSHNALLKNKGRYYELYTGKVELA